MSWLRLAVLLIGLGLGLVSEWLAFGFDDPLLWLPDLAVGLTWIASGIAAWPRSRSVSVLGVAVGATWFLGGIFPLALYWNRGPLVHLLLSYPGWRPRSNLAYATVVGGYVAAVTLAWHNEAASIVLACWLIVVARWDYGTVSGRPRHQRILELWATTALGLVLAAGAVARLIVRPGDAALLSLLAYEAVLCGIAIAATLTLRRSGTPAVTDLVVELGDTRSGTLRDSLARVLGDPNLQVGYGASAPGEYADDAGRPIPLPGRDDHRSATIIEMDGHPFAVLIHDVAVLEDSSLLRAVGAATRLTASNAELQAEVRAQLDELTASRRRLVVAADDELARLEARLERGAEQHLLQILTGLRTAAPGGSDEHLAKAVAHLQRTVEEVHDLARGLHPRELAEGLRPALAALAEGSAVPVQLRVTDERFHAEVEAAAYFTCAEALANVMKHSTSSSASIAVNSRDGQLIVIVVDDGIGGADPLKGSGLVGMRDRIEALGGRLAVESAQGRGTSLTATIPLSDEPS